MGNAWKREELRVSRALGSSRKLMKGTSEIEDVIHDIYDVDVKLRSRVRVLEWWEKLSEDARDKGKIPILVFRRPKVSKLRLAAISTDLGMRIYNHFGPCIFHLEEREAAHWSIENWFRELKKKAKDRIPMLCIERSDNQSAIMVMAFDNLVSALKGMDAAGATNADMEATGGH